MIAKRPSFILLCVIVLAFINQARAQGTATGTQYNWQYFQSAAVGGFKLSAEDACTQTLINGQASYPTNAYDKTLNGMACAVIFYTSPAKTSIQAQKTYNITSQSGSITLPCPAAGTTGTRNYTMGYSNSPNGGSDVAQMTIPQGAQNIVANGSTCAVNVGAPTKCWVSTQPNAQGLYRESCDFNIEYSGSIGTATPQQTAQTDATASAATCPGAYGTVNGKPTCIAPSLSSRNVVAPYTTGNPAAGSSGSDSLANRTPTTGGSGGNGGNAPTAQDGVSVTKGAGLPANGGTVASTSGGSGSSTPAEPTKTDCELKPNSIGCSEFGSPTNETLATSDSGFNSIGSVSLASASGCPAPESFSVAGHQYAVSFQPVCNGADSYIKPVMIVLGAALAAFIFIGGFKA